MRFALLCTLCLLVASSRAGAEDDERLKVLLMDLKTTAVDDDTAKLVADMMAVELSTYEEIEVFAGSDLKRLMELEAEKQVTGCEDDSCLADIAGALGARYVVFGRLGKLGSRVVVTLNLFDATQSKAINRVDLRAKGVDGMLDGLSKVMADLVAPIAKTANTAPVHAPPVVREPTPARPPTASAPGGMSAGQVVSVAGWGTVGAAYACGLFGLALVDVDPAALFVVLPVVGTAGWGALSFDSTTQSIAPLCYTCSAVQLVGLVMVGVGAFMGPSDEPTTKRVQEMRNAQPVVAAMAY